MIASLESRESPPRMSRHERLAAAGAVLVWLAIAGVIAASYIGHAHGPYGVCYSPAGRDVPCAVVRHR
jgi:hypothetical protein